MEYQVAENRPPPVRMTKKAIFILNEVAKLTKESKTSIAERALIDKYPLFSETYDKETK
jgi:hypothetical protein